MTALVVAVAVVCQVVTVVLCARAIFKIRVRCEAKIDEALMFAANIVALEIGRGNVQGDERGRD